jgi:ribosomal protein S18 acetylase RimI-like enzyme
MKIREYCDKTDRDGLYRCVECIQDFERRLVPSMPKGSEICTAYVADVLNQCARYEGKILVAVEDSEIIGYASIYTKMVSDEIEDSDEEFSYIGDLLVLDEYRGRGHGRELLRVAEGYAARAGTKTIRIGVLAANKSAVNLYRSMEYEPLAIQLEKNL